MVYRLQATDSTEEFHSNTSELLLLLNNTYKSKVILELTNNGKLLVFESTPLLKIGAVSKYDFSGKFQDHVSNKSKSVPSQSYLTTRMLIDDIKKWKTCNKTLFASNYQAHDSFTCAESIDTPRFTSDSLSVNGNDTKCKFPKSVILKHNTINDLWAIFENKVYDVTNYTNRHPEVSMCFLMNIGKDCSKALNEVAPSINPTDFFKDEQVGSIEI